MEKTEILAEIGQNHNGDMNLAVELIHAAKENGADAVKFQLYDARRLFPKENSEWYEYNCKTELSREQVNLLFEECEKAKIEFIASVFDVQRVNWLEEIGVLRYKIASRSIFDSDLIQAVVRTGKPIIASLGMWEKEEFPVLGKSTNIAYLYCISKYPTLLRDLDFQRVDFTEYAGFSDHTIGLTASMVAMARGAGIIEKHFTLDKAMYGPDHQGSMTPSELKQLSQFRTDVVQCM